MVMQSEDAAKGHPSPLSHPQPAGPKLVGAAALVAPLFIALAGWPVAGWRLSLAWLLAMAVLLAPEHRWFAWKSPRLGAILTWMRCAGYSLVASYLVLFHTGAAQTFGVTLYGVIIFVVLAKDYASPRRLALNLIPPALCVGLVQLAAAASIIERREPLLLITLFASPLAVILLVRSIQNDLTMNQRRLGDAITVAESSARKLQEAHRIARMAETLAGVGHWKLDIRNHGSSASDGVFKIYGLPVSEDAPPIEDILGLYHADDRDRVSGHLARALSDGAPFAFDARITRSDGEIRHVACSGTTERDADGKVVTVFGSLMDVTEARVRELALSESESRFRMLADHSTDVVVWTSVEGTILYASPASRLLGYAPEEVLGRKTFEFVHPDDRDRAINNTRALFTGELVDSSLQRQYRFLTPDGQYIWLEGNPTIIREPDGRPGSIVTSFRDVSARHQLEDDLISAKLRAEAAVEAKSEFLANMSHEIRTPLTGIIGFAGLLSEVDEMPPLAATYARRIASSGDALLCVVNDILDFSKLEAGQLELDPQPFEVGAFFEDTMAMVSTQAAAKGLELRLEINDGVPEVLNADCARLRQVLINLLGNAIKFTDQGSVRVTAAHDAVKNRLRVAVSDTGSGVPEDKLGRLFQRFSQVDGSVNRTHGGTGLGLSICKTLVELMGGGIKVRSVVGAGSTFEFWIAASPAELGEAEQHNVEAPADYQMRPAHILVVDDLDVNRELVRAILEATGHSVQEAAGGAEAVKAALQTRFDLILMDLQMPGMDGFAAASAIRGLASPNQRTPIVALTANVLPEHVRAGALAGMNDHIGKPIVPAELLGAVARWSGEEADLRSTALG